MKRKAYAIFFTENYSPKQSVNMLSQYICMCYDAIDKNENNKGKIKLIIC